MSDAASNGGIGFFGLLTILFIGLKLTGYVSWSWWWVMAPTWIPISLVLILLVLVGLITVVADK
jgi:hypothetical protein